MKHTSIVVFDGTSHFVETAEYILEDGEEIVFKGSITQCDQKCDELNNEC